MELVDGEQRRARPRADRGARARELARTFFRAYIRQVDGQGLLPRRSAPRERLLTPDGRLALLDFGLIGRLDDDTRTSLALLLLAIAQNRADDVADLILSISLTTMRVRRGRLRARPAAQAAALPVALARRHPHRERGSPTCSGSACSTGSRCRRRSRSSARRSHRPRASPARSTRRSTRSRCCAARAGS